MNVVMEMPTTYLGIAELAEVGVKRISVGSVLFLTAYGGSFGQRDAGALDIHVFIGSRFSELESIFASFEEH